VDTPNDQTITYYESAIPTDPRTRRGQMFGHPCAFVNGNMFLGTFGQSVIVRVGSNRAAALAKGKLRIFEPTPGRAWAEYVQVDARALLKVNLGTLAAEALEWTAKLPPKQTKAARSKAKTSKTSAKKAAAKLVSATKPVSPATPSPARRGTSSKTHAIKKTTKKSSKKATKLPSRRGVTLKTHAIKKAPSKTKATTTSKR